MLGSQGHPGIHRRAHMRFTRWDSYLASTCSYTTVRIYICTCMCLASTTQFLYCKKNNFGQRDVVLIGTFIVTLSSQFQTGIFFLGLRFGIQESFNCRIGLPTNHQQPNYIWAENVLCIVVFLLLFPSSVVLKFVVLSYNLHLNETNCTVKLDRTLV